MYFVDLFRKKTIAFYILLGVIVSLSIAALIVYAKYVSTYPGLLMVPWVIVFLALTIAGEITLFFSDNDYLPIVITVFPVCAFGFFLASPLATLFSVVIRLGIAEDVKMDGADPANFEMIIAIAVLCIVTAAAAVAACFFKRVKPKQAVS